MPRKISELFFELRAHTEGLQKDLDDSQRQLGKWSTFVANNPTAVVGALGVALLGIAIKVTSMAAETDTAMRKIAASVPTATAGIEEMGQELDAIAIKAGKTTQEIEAAAVQAAQHGARSAEEVAQIVQAATTFSDATGTALSASVDLIQQLMREFHLSGDDALKTLATLADVAQTAHVPVDELLSAFSAASPVFHKFDIDADTGTRAIVALVSAGFGIRQVRQELSALDGAGIRALAAQVPEATNQLDKLNARAAITEGSLSSIETGIRTKLNVQLKELGKQLLPARLSLEQFASDGLGAVIAALDKIKDRQRVLETIGAALGLPGIGALIGPAKTEPPKLTIDHEAPPFPFAPPKIVVPLSVAEKKQIADDLAFAQKAVNEFSQSTSQILASGTRSAVDNALNELDAFGNKFLEVSAAIRAKIAALPVNAPSSVRDQLQAQLDQLNAAVENGARERLTAIDRLAAQEASSIRATIGKELGELTGNLAQQAGSAITQQNAQLREQILLSDKISAADKLRLLHNVKLIELLQQQKNVALDATRDVERTIQGADLAGPTNKSFTDINAKAIALHQTLAELVKDGGEQAKQGEGYKIIQDAILKLDKERADLLKKLLGINKDVADSARLQMQTALDHARAIRDAVDGALQLAGAFGLVDQNTLSVLRSVGQIATSIPSLVTQLNNLDKVDAEGKALGSLSGLIGAALPIAGGIATLVSSILGSGPDRQDQERARALEENTAAIRDLTKHAGLIGQNLGISGGSASSVQQLLNDIIYGRVGTNSEPGNALGKISGLTQDQIDALNAAAKALGISLDGTLHGYQVLAYALDQVTPLLGKFGDSVTDMLNEIDAEAKILGKSSPLDNLAGILEKLGTKSAGVASIFEGIDTSKALSPDEIAKIRQRVQDLFKAMEGGGLTADQLGGLNGDQFLQLLEQIITDLDALGGAAQSAADKLNAALTRTQQSEQIHHVTDPVQQFADKAKDYQALGGSLGKLFEGIDLAHITPEQIAALDTQIQALFDKLKTSPDTVDLAGLSIDDLIKALLDLDSSATSVANTIATAAQKIADAESQIAVADDILGATGQQTISELSNAYNIDLSQFDLTTQPGAAAAISFLQDMFKGLDPNDPNYKEKEREIQNLVDRLRGLFPGGASGSASSASAGSGGGSREAVTNAAEALTQVTGNRMADYLASLVGLTRQEVGAMTQLVAALTRPIITGAILPPYLPSGFGVPRQAAQGSTPATNAASLAPQVNIRISRIDVVAPDGTDPAAFADSIGDALLERLAIKLQAIFAAQIANAQLRAGGTLTSA
jgi:hypothetical protein